MLKARQQDQFRFVLQPFLTVTSIVILGFSAYTCFAQSNGDPGHPANFSHSLPELDGKNLRATVVEVHYEPGEADKPHSHPCAVTGYVAEGAIRFQVKGGAPERVYKAGESFYEAPNGVHQVSANASDKDPAKLIAFFICDHGTPLTVPPVNAHTGHKAK